MVEVVLDLGLRLDETEPQPFEDVEVRSTVRPLDVDGVQSLQRRLEVVDAKRYVLQRTPLPRPLGLEERQLAAPRVRADECELVGALDDVHREPLGREVRDPLAVRDPEGDVIQGLGPHPAFTLPRRTRPKTTYYFLRLTAASSCCLFIRERPLTFRRLAWL